MTWTTWGEGEGLVSINSGQISFGACADLEGMGPPPWKTQIYLIYIVKWQKICLGSPGNLKYPSDPPPLSKKNILYLRLFGGDRWLLRTIGHFSCYRWWIQNMYKKCIQWLEAPHKMEGKFHNENNNWLEYLSNDLNYIINV